MAFKKATKSQAFLRMALLGPAGSGKTFDALTVAAGLGGRTALIDTEHGSASKYADRFDFDTEILEEFSPERYVRAIADAVAAGYDNLIIDSLSHAWAGKGGILEFVDNKARANSGNSFGVWRDATPKHNALVEAMLAARLHLIVTMRVKMEYVQEKDERGKTSIRKVGLQPVQRDGLEYEFDIVADLDNGNNLIVTKSRCFELSGATIAKPTSELGARIRAWLTDGAPVPEPQAPEPPAAHDRPTPTAADARGADGESGIVTEAQIAIIDGMARQAGLYDPSGATAVEKWHKLTAHTASLFGGKTVKGLTKAEAEALIANLTAPAESESEGAKLPGFGG